MHELLSKMNICKNLVIIDCATLEAIWKGNTNLLELLLNKNGFECERLCDEYNGFNFLLWPLFIDWLNALKHDGEFELFVISFMWCNISCMIDCKHLDDYDIEAFTGECYDAEFFFRWVLWCWGHVWTIFIKFMGNGSG